jgi:hypothetical protein
LPALDPASETARIAAGRELLDRAYGKARLRIFFRCLAPALGKDSSTNMVDHEAVQICFDIAGHAANARRTTSDSNCSAAQHRRVIGIASCINLVFSG